MTKTDNHAAVETSLDSSVADSVPSEDKSIAEAPQGMPISESEDVKPADISATASTNPTDNIFDLETLCSHSESLFGCHSEVVLGAVGTLGVKKEKFSKSEIKAAIKSFRKMEVKPNV